MQVQCLLVASHLLMYPLDGSPPFDAVHIEKLPAHEEVYATNEAGQTRVFGIYQHQLRMDAGEWIEDCVLYYSAGLGDDIDVNEQTGQ